MKYEFRRKLLHEDYDTRLRVFIDPDCTQANAATVTMLDDELTVYDTQNEGWTHERLMSECMRTAAWLRSPASLGKHYPHPGDLIPFADVLLTDRDRLGARTRLLVAAGVKGQGDDHLQRVEGLGEAVDLLAFLERKKKRAAK